MVVVVVVVVVGVVVVVVVVGVVVVVVVVAAAAAAGVAAAAAGRTDLLTAGAELRVAGQHSVRCYCSRPKIAVTTVFLHRSLRDTVAFHCVLPVIYTRQ